MRETGLGNRALEEGTEYWNVLEGERVGPVVRDGAHEEDRRIRHGPDTGQVQRRIRREEVLRLEGDAPGREELCVLVAPGLPNDRVSTTV